MRRRALVLLLWSACSTNVAELESYQAMLERQLAEKKDIANNLNPLRREMDALDQQLLDAADGGAPPPARVAPAPTTFPPLPPESSLEGSRAQLLRRRIAETQQRIVELDKVLGEVRNIEAHRREVREQLERLKKKAAPEP